MGCTVRIERLENGFEVELDDPKVVKANQSAKSGEWKNPTRSYAFKTLAEVMDFLSRNLEKALPESEYSTAFAMAAKEEEDE
jgi:hypothetical protein